MATNSQVAFTLIFFWVVLLTLTGLVSANIAFEVAEGDVTQILDDLAIEGGFFSTIFVWVANLILNTLGFENVAIVALGFAALPEWLNFMLFVPLVFFTVYAIVVSFLPTGG